MTKKEAGENRRAAKAAGEKYYHGSPCKKCGSTLKWICNCQCRNCHYKKSNAWMHKYQRSWRGWAMQTYRNAKRRATRDGLPFSITVEHILAAIPKDRRCPVLGYDLRPGRFSEWGPQHIPSLEQCYPRGGYTPDNIRVISYYANMVLGDASPRELRLAADWREKEQADWYPNNNSSDPES